MPYRLLLKLVVFIIFGTTDSHAGFSNLSLAHLQKCIHYLGDDTCNFDYRDRGIIVCNNNRTNETFAFLQTLNDTGKLCPVTATADNKFFAHVVNPQNISYQITFHPKAKASLLKITEPADVREQRSLFHDQCSSLYSGPVLGGRSYPYHRMYTADRPSMNVGKNAFVSCDILRNQPSESADPKALANCEAKADELKGELVACREALGIPMVGFPEYPDDGQLKIGPSPKPTSN